MALPNTIPTRTSEDANSAADVNALMENCAYLLSVIEILEGRIEDLENPPT
jgi:hypothetical protein